jgi:hypothetical protein
MEHGQIVNFSFSERLYGPVDLVSRGSKLKALRGLSPRANYTDRAAAAGRRPNLKYLYKTETACKRKKLIHVFPLEASSSVINDTAGSMAGPERICLESDRFLFGRVLCTGIILYLHTIHL